MPALLGAGDEVAGDALSMADSGRGGPIVPKRIEASCLAEPPVGLSSSSEESSAEDSAIDQSSSSTGFAVRRADCATGSGSAVLPAAVEDSCVMR